MKFSVDNSIQRLVLSISNGGFHGRVVCPSHLRRSDFEDWQARNMKAIGYSG